MDITTKTVVELKALAYDELAKLETAQRNIALINAEIKKKVEAEQPAEKPVSE